MKSFLIFFSVVLFSGCSSLQDFSKRKYMPRYFSSANNKKSFTENLQVPDARFIYAKKNYSEEEKKSCSAKTDDCPSVKQPAFHHGKKLSVLINPDEKISHETNLFLPAQKNTSPSTPDEELEKYAERSVLFGVLSICFLLLFFPFLLSLPFAIIAITNANRVLRHPGATEKQRSKARLGKTLGNIVAACFVIPIIVVAVLIYLGVITFPI